jgi:hypothetical protein
VLDGVGDGLGVISPTVVAELGAVPRLVG